jgi:hypothetical protein
MGRGDAITAAHALPVGPTHAYLTIRGGGTDSGDTGAGTAIG